MPFASASHERSPAIDHQIVSPVQATSATARGDRRHPGAIESREQDRATRPPDDDERGDDHRGCPERRSRTGAGGVAGEERPGEEHGDRRPDGSDEA